MRPFGCPVTILNTLDPLGKFDGKADEWFLVGYSINSKAFRVFNSRTRKVEENLHKNFLENKPNAVGSGPEWLFDIDSLTKSINYEPVTVGNQTNGNAGIETNVNARQAGQEKASDHEYILLPLMLSNSSLSSSTQSTDDKDANEVPDKGDNDKEGYANSTNKDSTASLSVSTVGPSINTTTENINTRSPNINTASPIPNDSSMQYLENTGIFDDAYDDREVGTEADLNNLETTMNFSHIPTTKIYKDHPKDQIIGDINSATQTRKMTKISEEHAIVSYIKKQRRTNHKDYQNCLFACFLSEIEPKKTLVDLPKGKRAIGTKWVYINKKDERGMLETRKDWLHKVYVDDIIFGSTKKSLCVEFEQMMHKRFQMSSMGELTFFLGLQVQQKEDGIFISQDKYVADILKTFDFVTIKTASTPMEPNKALVKDEEADNVDVHLYRSMIGSLIYLTASRPDITFDVCTCARFQVTPKVSHLYAVNMIFRYLKALTGNPQQEVLWIQNQMLDYGFNFMNTKIYIDNESTICIVKNLVIHYKTKHIEIRHHFIRDSHEKKLIQVIKIHTDHNVADLLTKAFDVSRFNFLIASIGMLNL
ncbi:uncharacterized mitochondrial protein-like protein [Tanacetum coccineum]